MFVVVVVLLDALKLRIARLCCVTNRKGHYALRCSGWRREHGYSARLAVLI